MTKHIVSFVLLSFVIVAVTSCSCSGGSKEQKEVVLNENGLPVFEFNSQDSLDIVELGNAYVKCFNASDYEAAADLLHIVRNDSILPLTAEQRQGYLMAMRSIPHFGCAQKELELFSDRDNKLRIAILMSEDGNLMEDKGTINFFLNPVEKDGKWYLTLLDEYAEGVGLYH